MHPEYSTDYLWRELHEKQGMSSKASIAAAGVLQQIDTQNFSDFDQRVVHAEYARLAVVTGTSAAKKAEKYLHARANITRSLEIVRDHYPIGKSHLEADRRNAFWQNIYPNESAHLMALRDTWNLLHFLTRILDSYDLEQMAGGLQNLLIEIAGPSTERFALILKIEHLEYPYAVEAFYDYVQQYGPDTPLYDPYQALTVISKIFHRALEANDDSFSIECVEAVAIIQRHARESMDAATSKEISKYAQEKVFNRNLLPSVNLARHQAWQGVAQIDRRLAKPLKQTLTYLFVGTGPQVVKLSDFMVS